jgi:predicted amidohydrolase YtcJ
MRLYFVREVAMSPACRKQLHFGAPASVPPVLFLLFFISVGFRSGQIAPQPHFAPSVELILHAGKIITVDKDFSVRSAIAIANERILAIGENSAILAMAGPDTRVIDLAGRTVIPGLSDDHYHMLQVAKDAYLGVNVTLASSVSEMLGEIQAKVETMPPGATVYTMSGWLPEQLKEKRPPSRAELDSVSPGNPVVVLGGHTQYLNSYALRAVGITRDTPSPPGGFIQKDLATGEPTGLLVDNAMALSRKLLPIATDEQKREALRRAMKVENSVGITSIREPTVDPADMRVYQELWKSGEMTLRVSMNLNLDPQQPASTMISQLSEWGVSTGFGDTLLRLDGIGEFGMDGGFQAALMTKPYATSSQIKTAEPFRGLQRIPTDKFDEVVEAMNRLNWRPCVHSVGDEATDKVLDAYEKANAKSSILVKRWVLEHGHYMRPDQYARIKKLGVVISTQFHPFMAAQTMVENWGSERASRAMPVREWLDADLRVGGGSDWTLLPANPFWIISFFVTRESRLWGLIGPQERISRREALEMLTMNNAYITFEENIKGSIEPGKLADLVVLSDDILTVPDEKIKEITPVLTILGGQIVYSNGSINVR